ncbi:unnamed protein product [Amoebophrya sp. A120]|nr:unnamed protein product [Amoebophrya sp. A120]|eukprot:GSA120T00025680001.1
MYRNSVPPYKKVTATSKATRVDKKAREQSQAGAHQDDQPQSFSTRSPKELEAQLYGSEDLKASLRRVLDVDNVNVSPSEMVPSVSNRIRNFVTAENFGQQRTDPDGQGSLPAGEPGANH